MHPANAHRVVVIADGEPPAPHDPASHALADAVHGAHVLLVAPASAGPGERWIVDLDAREAQARRRLHAWAVVVAAHASAVETEVGDPSARLAPVKPCAWVMAFPVPADASGSSDPPE